MTNIGHKLETDNRQPMANHR